MAITVCLPDHMEDNESLSSDLVREVKKEIGIELKPKDLRPVHIMHRKKQILKWTSFLPLGIIMKNLQTWNRQSVMT